MDNKKKLDYLYELFTLATNYSGTGVCVIDANTRELYFCNHAGFLSIEGKKAEYQGLPCYEALFNRNQPCENCLLEQAKLGKEKYIIHVKEQGITLQVKSQIVHWEDRDLLVEFITDISDDTKHLEAIQKEEVIKKNNFDLAKTKMINDSDLISYIIYDLTNDHFVSTASGKYCDLTKYRDCSALSVFAQDMSKIIIDPEKRSEYIAVHNRNNLLKKHFAGEKDTKLDIEMKLANNQERWERIELLTAENPENGSIYLFEYAYDINKEKNVEIMMDFAVNDEYDLIGNVNFHTGDCVLMYGENSFNVFGKRVVEENYDVSLERFIKEGVQDDYQERYRQLASLESVKRNLQEKNVYEVIIYTKYGNEKRVKRDRYSLYGPESNYCLFTQTDITEVLAIEEQKRNELQKALNNANAATEAKSVFLSRMSHDMRTPMNGILGMTALSKEEQDIRILHDNIDKIHSSGEYLLGLINETLDYQKIESGQLSFVPQIISAKELLDSVNGIIEPMAKAKGVTYKVVIEKVAIMKYVKIDPIRIRQIFINILSNAVKFTPSGGCVTFSQSLVHRDKEFSTIKYIVQDSGCGMSEDFVKNRLFKPFAQELRSELPQSEGTGLGLSIVKRLVELMNGTISVESNMSQGTTFTIILDYPVINENEVEHKQEDNNQKIEDIVAVLKNKRILLVEDHPLNAQIAKKILEKAEVKVELAANGQIGIDMFDRSFLNYYDLILMDLRMPVLGGIEAAKRIRSLPREDAKRIPIIAVSANAYVSDVQECLDAGMNDHVAKPYNPNTLYATIAKYLNN